MKVLHTSDWHVGRTIRGRSRHHEHDAVLAEMVEIVEDEQIDLVIVAGDQFDTAAPSARAERTVWRTLLGFADRGAKVVVVAGNHDNAAKLEALRPLLTRGGEIEVAPHVRSPSQGGVVRVSTRSGDARVALVPFLSQRGIVQTAQLLDHDAAQHAQAYAGRVRIVLEALTSSFGSGDTADLVAGHLTVVGAGKLDDQLGGGERLSQIFDYVVPPQAFPTSAHYVALGHLHQPHGVPAPAPVRYAGSPLHLDFGEVASQRGVTIVEVTPQGSAEIRHRPVRGGFRLVTLRGELPELRSQAEQLGDDVYVRAVVEEAPRAGLAEAVRSAVPQAVDVRVAAAVDAATVERIAADDVATSDPGELFGQFLSSRGVEDERVVKLFGAILDDLQAVRRGAGDDAQELR